MKNLSPSGTKIAWGILLSLSLSLAAEEKPSLEELLTPSGAVPKKRPVQSAPFQLPPRPTSSAKPTRPLLPKKADTTSETEPPPRALPSLPVDSLDPTPHLPGFPKWIIGLLSILGLVLLVGLLLLALKIFKKPRAPEPRENPIIAARARMNNLKSLPPETPLAEISTRISLIIRHYLADSRSENALYQTREEFLTSENKLRSLQPPARQKVSSFLDELANLQYAPPIFDKEQLTSLIDHGSSVLDAIASQETLKSRFTTAND